MQRRSLKDFVRNCDGFVFASLTPLGIIKLQIQSSKKLRKTDVRVFLTYWTIIRLNEHNPSQNTYNRLNADIILGEEHFVTI